MPTTFPTFVDKDEVLIPVYYRDDFGALRQFSVDCPMQDIKQNVNFARTEVICELVDSGNFRDNMAVLALINGGKA